jgi:DNA-binding transcriptional LysR family regulator
MDLHRLRFLREFEERGTLGAVATALGYSPSAVSQQLTVLEKEVGTPLLERAGRGVRLTDAGRLLAQHARVLLAAAEAATSDLAALGEEVRGTVRAGGVQSAARHLLVPSLARMASDHPLVRMEVSELELEQALPGLRLGSVDLVISDDYDGHPRPRPAGMRFEPLLSERLFIVLPAAHPLAAQGGPVALADLRDMVWVSSDETTGHHAMIVGNCRAIGGYEPDVRHHSNDADVQLAVVRHAPAVALLPLLNLPPEDPTLAYRPVAETDLGRRLFTVTRDRPMSPALTAFLSVVTERAADLTSGPAPSRHSRATAAAQDPADQNTADRDKTG